MKLGIKVGLKGNSALDLKETKPDFCEIWFHSGKISEYEDLFAAIKKTAGVAGLHFWGATSNGTLANLAYPDRAILKESIKLVKKTIEAAAKNHCWYVNVHPGAGRLIKVNLASWSFEPYGAIIVDFDQCQNILEESLAELAAYAKQRGVALFVESVPKRAFPGVLADGSLLRRLQPVNLFELPLEYIEPVLEKNIDNLYFTNDFGHTAANIINKPRETIKQFLFTATKRLAPRTRLVHVGYLIPPYNGTDYHGSLYKNEFKTSDALPNETEMIQLLALFKNRPDVGALVEPEKDHPANFQILRQLTSYK